MSLAPHDLPLSAGVTLSRGRKREHCRSLASLREYVPIDPAMRAVYVFRRNASGHCLPYPFRDGETVDPESLDCRMPPDVICEGVDFSSTETAKG